MMSNPIGNEQQMEEIKKTMELHQKVQAGGERKEGIQLDFTTTEGNRYQGVAIFKKPTVADFLKIGGLKSEMLRESGVQDLKLVDEAIKFMAHVVATLDVVLHKRPEWLLEPRGVKEAEILYYVYGKYEEWEDSFRKDVSGTADGNNEDSAGKGTLDTA